MSVAIGETRTMGTTVRVLDDFDEFLELEDAWTNLHGRASLSTPFLSHEWIRTWWTHFARSRDFRIITLSEDGESESLVGAAPLALETRRSFGISYRTAEILGTSRVEDRGMGLADRADFLVDSDHPEAYQRLLHAVLEELDWDILHLKAIPGRGHLAEAARRLQNVRRREFDHDVSPYVPCEGTWDSYLKDRSKTFRKSLRKMRNRVQKLDGYRMDRFHGAEAVSHIPEIFAVNEKSWKGDAGSALFESPRIRSFFLDLADAMASRQSLLLYTLSAEQKTIAYEVCLEGPRSVVAYNASFDPDYGKLSPGIVLSGFILEDTFSRGCSEYDQSRGDHEYKRRWNESHREEKQVAVVRPGWKPYAAYLLRVGLRSWIKTLPGLPAFYEALTRRRREQA